MLVVKKKIQSFPQARHTLLGNVFVAGQCIYLSIKRQNLLIY